MKRIKKILSVFLAVLIIGTNVGLPLTNVYAQESYEGDELNISTDDYDDYGEGGGNNETVDMDGEGVAASYIQKLDFLGGTLLTQAIKYMFIYPGCFKEKKVGSKSIVYAIPELCVPRDKKDMMGTRKPLKVSELKIEDLLDGKYLISNKGFIIIPFIFTVGLLIWVVFMKYEEKGGGGGTGGFNNQSNDDTGTNQSSSGGDDNALGSMGKGMLQGTIGGWFIEKIFGKNVIAKEGEEQKSKGAVKIFAIVFIFLIVTLGSIFSITIDRSLPIYFDKGFTGTGPLFGVGVLYGLSYIIFISTIFILIKFILISFIKADMQKDESINLEGMTARLMFISLLIIAVVSMLVSQYLIQFISILFSI